MNPDPRSSSDTGSGRSRRPAARARRRLLLALGVWLLAWGAGCTTPGPASHTTASRAEDPARAPESENAKKAADADAESAPPPDSASSESETESLRFARIVLERKGGRKLDPGQREGIARLLAGAEREHGIPVVLLLAMIELESRFDPRAKGPAGSIGLMQLQPATARAIAGRSGVVWRNDRTLLDPEKNARLGLAYLAELRGQFETTDQAIAAYNIGPSRLRRLLAKRPLTHGPYLRKIHAHADALHQAFGEHARNASDGKQADSRQ